MTLCLVEAINGVIDNIRTRTAAAVERRNVLRQNDQMRRAEEANAMKQTPNVLQIGLRFAMDGNFEAAGAYLEKAKQLFPTFIYENNDAVWLLIFLKQFDEAEALMRRGRKQGLYWSFNGQRRYAVGMAEIAESRGDLEEAIRRWGRVPYGADESFGLMRAAVCLRKMENLDHAEALLLKAARRSPDDKEIWIELARISDARQDWVTSAERWKCVVDRFANSHGYAGYAMALSELGKAREANELLALEWPNHMRSVPFAVARARIYERLDDLDFACHYWAVVRDLDSGYKPGYEEGVRCLLLAKRGDETDDLISVMKSRFT